MCKRLIYFVSYVLVLGLFGSASARTNVDWVYNEADANNWWNNPNNWSGALPEYGGLPTRLHHFIDSSDDQRVRIDMVGEKAPVIDERMNGVDSPVASCIDLYMSDRTGDSLLTITGGVLEVADRFMIGRGDGDATVVMSGGIINQMVATEYSPPESGRMDIGNRTGHSSLQMTGGEIHIDGGLNIGNWESRGGNRSKAFGHIQLDGGLIDADWISLRCDDTNLETRGTIDITGDSVLQIRGNAFLDVDYGTEGEMNWYGGLWFQDYLDLGWISGYGKVRGVLATYDEETDITTVVADIEGPERSYKPYPRSGTTDMPYDLVPYWTPGDNAVQHDVYIGTDFDDVNEADISDLTGVYRGRQDANSYTGGLEWGQTCYWRIDEVEANGAIHKGYIWSLTVADYLVVDDFEDYNDYEPYRIFDTWADGWDNPLNGATVGYPNPDFYKDEHFVETTTIHGGGQAMPYFYDNSGTTGNFYSEAKTDTADLAIGQDWTRADIKTLTLWFYGDPNNTANVNERMYVKLNGAKVEYDGDANNIKQASWHEWNIELASFGVDLQNVTEIRIGFGDETNTTPGGSGKILFDDIRLYRTRCIPSLRKPQGDVNNDCKVDYVDLEIMSSDWLNTDYYSPSLVAWYKFDGNANDSSGNDRHGDPCGTPTYMTGKFGQAVSLTSGEGDYIEIIGYKGVVGSKPFTVCAWIRTADDDGVITCWGSLGNGNRAEFRVDDDRLRCDHGGGNVQGRTIVSDYEWHHVALMVKGRATASYPDAILYLDGQDDTIPSTDPDPFHVVAETNVRIGSRSTHNDRFFDGFIDDVRIYDRVLSQAEIVSFMDGSLGSISDYHPLTSPANLYDAEPEGSKVINLKDYAVLADTWLDKQLWP